MLPTLGLLVGLLAPPGVFRLVFALRRWCLVRYALVDEKVDAWLATSPQAVGLDRALKDPMKRVAVWIETLDDLGSPVPLERAEVLVTGDPGVASSEPSAIFLPRGVQADGFLPITPFVRSRWRRRFGLPEMMVVSAGVDGALSDEVLPTALALASAVAARGRWLIEALAWGAPCATDIDSARSLGAEHNVEVVIEEPDRLKSAARDLAHDPVLSASLSRAGRRLVEQQHDESAPVGELAFRLGLVRESSPEVQLIADRLAELWTPPESIPARRAKVAFHLLQSRSSIPAVERGRQ